jgi:hypothetical protein
LRNTTFVRRSCSDCLKIPRETVDEDKE